MNWSGRGGDDGEWLMLQEAAVDVVGVVVCCCECIGAQRKARPRVCREIWLCLSRA
jgi:hypothetical protein